MNHRPGRYRWRTAFAWLAILFLVASLPIGIALADAPPRRGFWLDLSAGLGLLGLGLLVVQALTSGRQNWVAPDFGADNLLHFHRRLGLLASLLILAHPIVMFTADPSYLRVLDPRDGWMAAAVLWTLVGSLFAILVSSFWRKALGLSYELWRLLHGGLALLIMALAVGHALAADHSLHAVPQRIALIVWMGLAIALIVNTRLYRPWSNRHRPWQVESVKPERGDAWTLTLRPIGHDGLRFEPGQYAWFTLADSPFAMQQHPFSLAGTARSAHLSFTAAVVGDFTAALAKVKPGARAWVEGPMGSFIPDPDRSIPLFMVAGGIGITPMMSMLRTFHAQGSRRKVDLVYANNELGDVTFLEELEILEQELNLRVIHVLREPPAGWPGESGLVDENLLDRCLPPPGQPTQYMVCGPEPLMDTVEAALRDRGVDWRRVYSERFEVI